MIKLDDSYTNILLTQKELTQLYLEFEKAFCLMDTDCGNSYYSRLRIDERFPNISKLFDTIYGEVRE